MTFAALQAVPAKWLARHAPVRLMHRAFVLHRLPGVGVLTDLWLGCTMMVGNTFISFGKVAIMLNTLKMPNHNELISLPDVELIKRVRLALGQLDNADKQGESTADETRIYQIYKNELARRDYKQHADTLT